MGGTRENEEEGGGRGTQDQPESWGRSAHPSSRRGLPHPVWVPSLPLQIPVPQVPPSGLQDLGWALGRPTRPSTHIRALPRQHCSPAGLGTGVCEGER